jgi:hypothetical protein
MSIARRKIGNRNNQFQKHTKGNKDKKEKYRKRSGYSKSNMNMKYSGDQKGSTIVD